MILGLQVTDDIFECFGEALLILTMSAFRGDMNSPSDVSYGSAIRNTSLLLMQTHECPSQVISMKNPRYNVYIEYKRGKITLQGLKGSIGGQ